MIEHLVAAGPGASAMKAAGAQAEQRRD